jgi:hypothetical protein
VIGTHSRFTRQLLGYAERALLARVLFYYFQVRGLVGGVERQKEPLLRAAASVPDGQSLASL